MIRQLDDRTLVSGQIRPEEVAGLAEQRGITMLINNRPDGEESDQPLASAIEAAAEAAGISYRHIPIIRGIGPADVEAMQEALRETGEGQVLAFCRSGTRSALTWALAVRGEGRPREEVERKVEAAGFNVAPIEHLL
ncbi:MAG TPA: TIGR01244 family sulfur transferase [Sphingomicrobium sp.]|nr:TIGR01244 family sulfur transferase [Sphingomicrobium sp.]